MYIAQAFNWKHELWRYTIIPFLFFGFMGLNFFIVYFFDIDTTNFLKNEIEKKGSNRVLFENLMAFAVFLCGLLVWVIYSHKQTIKQLTTSRKKVDWGRIFFGFGLISIFTTVITFLDYNSNPNNYVFQFEAVPFLIMAVIAIILIPIQTSFEEYFFRGYLMQGIGVMARNKWVPLLITSVIFGGLHFFNPEVDKLGNIVMIYYIGTGFFLGIITLMDEGLELALGFHAGNNLLVALLVTADWTAFQTNSIFLDVSEPTSGIDVLIPVFVIYPIFIALMAWKYKWTNWGEKLLGKVQAPPKIEPVDATN